MIYQPSCQGVSIVSPSPPVGGTPCRNYKPLLVQQFRESQTKFLQIEQSCQVELPPALVLVVDDFRGTVEKIEDLSFTLDQNNDLDESTLRKNLED